MTTHRPNPSCSVRVHAWLVLGLATGLVACSGDERSDGNAAGGVGGAGLPGAGTGAGSGGTAAGSGGGSSSGTTGSGATGASGGGTGGSALTGSGGDGGGGEPTPAASVWAQMGYDAKSQYYNPLETTLSVENAAQLELKWTFEVAGFPPGVPVIAEGKVFAMATGGLYAINLEDGSEAWQRPEIAGLSFAVAYHEGSIYVHGDPPELYRLNAADGTTIWGPIVTSELPGADGESSPVVAGGKVLVGQSNGYGEISGGEGATRARGGVRAFNLEDGSPAWRYYTVPESGENGASVWSTVSVDEQAGVVYATTGNNYTVGGGGSDAFHAIDLATGAGLWVHQVRTGDTFSLLLPFPGQDTDFGANPIVADFNGRKLVAAGDKGAAFWAIDRESDTGEMVWNVPALSAGHNPANGGVLNNGAFDGTSFFVTSNEPPAAAVLHALNPEDGSDHWTVRFNKVTWGVPSVANGVLVVPVNEDLHILNARTGETLTMFATGGSIAGGAAIVDGKVIVKSGMQYLNFQMANVINNNQIHCYGLP